MHRLLPMLLAAHPGCVYTPLPLTMLGEPETRLLVAPTYPVHGADWNDYVRTVPGSEPTGTDSACTGDEPGGYAACVHGGEHRRVVVTGEPSCTPLSLSEALGALVWECHVVDGTATYLSAALRDDKGLADLVDFARPAWRMNRVVVTKDGQPLAQSAWAIWWHNPVAALPNATDARRLVLDTPGTVYLVGTTRQSGGVNLNADRLALVIKPEATLTYAGNGAFNCAAGTGEAEPADGLCLVAAGQQRSLWLEGTFDGAGRAMALISFADVRTSVLRRLRARRASGTGIFLTRVETSRLADVTLTELSGADADGLVLEESVANDLVDLTVNDVGGHGVVMRRARDNYARVVQVSRTGDDGLYLEEADANLLEKISVVTSAWAGVALVRGHGNTLQQLSVADSGSDGLLLLDTDQNRVHGVSVANAGSEAVTLEYGSSDNILTDIRAANVVWEGVWMVGSGTDDNTVVGLTCTNTTPCLGIADGASRNTVGYVTAANCLTGLSEGGSIHVGAPSIDSADPTPANTIFQVAVVNSELSGIVVRADQTTVAQVAVTDSDEYGLVVSSDENSFAGVLLLGGSGLGPCQVDLSFTNPGLDANCSSTLGSAPATVLTASAAHAFAGKVTVDDAHNASDNAGSAVASQISDWLSFETPWRGWGADGDTFPSPTNRGQCHAGNADACRIWDWRLRHNDAVLRNTSGDGQMQNAAFLSGAACPTAVGGEMTLTDRQSNPHTFLINAMEIIGDGSGDDNGLCESNEACLYSPNFGAYQGHGDDLLAPCDFQNGAVFDVEIYAHPANGA